MNTTHSVIKESTTFIVTVLIFELCTIFLIFNIVCLINFFRKAKAVEAKKSMAEYKLKTKRERFTFPPNLKKAFACLVLRNLKFYILD